MHFKETYLFAPCIYVNEICASPWVDILTLYWDRGNCPTFHGPYAYAYVWVGSPAQTGLGHCSSSCCLPHIPVKKGVTRSLHGDSFNFITPMSYGFSPAKTTQEHVLSQPLLLKLHWSFTIDLLSLICLGYFLSLVETVFAFPLFP